MDLSVKILVILDLGLLTLCQKNIPFQRLDALSQRVLDNFLKVGKDVDIKKIYCFFNETDMEQD